MTTSVSLDERILVLMPSARDGIRTQDALAAADLQSVICRDLTDLCSKIAEGAGVALLTEESVTNWRAEELQAVLTTQPAWSDLPLIVIAREAASCRHETLHKSMNVTLVERPVRMRSLISVLRAAMRSRQHQYAVRGLLQQGELQAEALRDKESRLRFVLEAARLGSWDLNIATGDMDCSDMCKLNFGRPLDRPFPYEEQLAAIHPDDRELARKAVEMALLDHNDYDVEYRVIWPNQTVHWILSRGRLENPVADQLRMSGITLDVTRLKQAEADLREADRRKDEFLATLAHELRNPLAPIRNGLQVLRMSNELGAESAEIRELMERQANHLVHLVDDLMEVSRVSRGKVELRKEVIPLSVIVDSAIEMSRALVDDAEHELVITLPQEPVLLYGDRVRLSQVLANLLTNAAKYMDVGGRIELAARIDAGELEISVRDAGLGIPLDMLPRVFEIFTQMEHTRQHSQGGLGIGLALAKSLVEMHGGTIYATSAGLDQGSTFIVRLPLASSAADSVLPAAEPEGPLPRCNVIILDDTRAALFVLEKLLKAMGQNVKATSSASTALEWARQEQPDIIISDIGMPDVDGYEFARRVRAVPELQDTLLVALTGYGQQSDRKRAQEAGFNRHLVKPVSVDELHSLLATIGG